MAKINPLNTVQFERLLTSIEWSNRMLETPRRKRIEAVREFVGIHHTENSAEKRVIAPFLKMAITIHLRLLAARAPAVLISTKEESLKSTAANMEIAVNEIPKEIGLQNTLRRIVLEAMFSSTGGVAKVGLQTVGELLGHRIGTPFVDVVTQDDYILDMSAKHISQIQYEGNSYWLDYKDVIESDWFDKKALDGLDADRYTIIGEAGEERAESIGQDESANLFKKKIYLRDIWLPSEKLMVTYAVKSKKRLKTIDWTGPELGPYAKLRFDDVPGNLLSLAPISIWRDIHELANALYRKLAKQADAQKTVLGFTGGNDESANDFKEAKDGDGIMYTGPKPEPLTAGGINQGTLAFFLQSKDMFSWMAGNLDSLGGLSPQSETLGQDKLIGKASSAQIQDMAAQVIDFSRDVFRSLAYYEWHDPLRRRKLEKTIPGTDLKIIVPWNQDSRIGRFDMYDLDIDVHSLQDNSPAVKLQKLGVIMQQYIIPLMPAIEAQSGSFDVQYLLELVGKYADFPEMKDLVVFMQQTENAAKGQSARKPANTTRTVERVNRPGATESGKSQILQQALLGGVPQQSEVASLGRPTG